MTEINGTNFSVNKVNVPNTPKQQDIQPQDIKEEAAPKLTDFSDPKAEALGRSMLIKDADNINRDLKVLVENPQIAENSDKMFETAFKALQDNGAENPYEEAASFATGNNI